jgi:hypothetical protein
MILKKKKILKDFPIHNGEKFMKKFDKRLQTKHKIKKN